MSDQPSVGAVEQEPSTGYERLETQIKWYDSRSSRAQWWYKRIKIAELICAALVPFTATISAITTAALGVAVVILESIEQLNQYHHNWITYRSTCEALRHEKYSYLGRTGSYISKDDIEAKKILVEQVEALISTEHSKWISHQAYQKPSQQPR